MNKEFWRIHKLFCVLLLTIGLILLFGNVVIWIIFLNTPNYKKLEDYNINTSIIQSNDWVKEKGYGENGKRYSLDE